MAWLAERLEGIAGSGIIYTLTIADAERLADWLRSKNIISEVYHSNLKSDLREELEDSAFNQRNQSFSRDDSFRNGVLINQI